MKRIAIACLLLLPVIALAQTPNQNAREALKSARTLHISVSEGSSLDLKAEIVKKLTKWGKLTLVSTPDNADLVLRVEQTRGFSAWKGKGAKGAALLTDRRSGVELWSANQGGDWAMSGYSIGRVGRQIADKMIKFCDKQTQ